MACLALLFSGCSMEYRAKRAIAKKEGWSMDSFICTQKDPPKGRKFIVRRKSESGYGVSLHRYYYDGSILLEGWW